MPPKRKQPNRVQTVMFSKDMVILVKKYSKLEKVTGATIISDFNELVKIPKTHTLSDWLIVNAIDFFERVELLYSSCSLFCTVDTCPMFNAGPHYHYFWEDADSEQPVQLSAPEYFNCLKRYIKRNFANQKLFPRESGAKLSEEALTVLRTTYRRLFRILAHLYMCHFSYILKFKFENVINTILGHYATFALQYDMISPQDIEMLRPVFTAMSLTLPGLDN